MENVSEVQAAVALAPARVKLSAWAACPSAAADGRLTHVTRGPATKTDPYGVEGTGVSPVSGARAQQFIRKPYNFMTHILATSGGGDPGPHPAREPEPV
jgi:hypothetical protein